MFLSPADLSKVFPVYSSLNTSIALAWVVSDPNTDSIHRFFDSSPFSPSNRYIAYTEISVTDESHEETSRELRENKYSDYATVVMVDLRSGERKEVGKTLAWDSQVGAHVQWGNDDGTLFYNSFGEGLSYDHHHYCHLGIAQHFSTQAWPLPVGVAYNTYTGEKKTKNCPIYHVSPDGHNSVAPNMFKIEQTQQGYGIPLKKIVDRHQTFIAPAMVDQLTSPNKEPDHWDGMFKCSLIGSANHCELDFRLQQLVSLAGFGKSPTYGFHTKWSPDSRLVMFVVRTLEKPASSTSVQKRVRVQHLFVIRPNNGEVKHVVSWASKPFLSSTTGQVVYLPDGNHPNWIPCTIHNQTEKMSLRNGTRVSRSYGRSCCATYKISMNLQVRVSKRKEPPHWQIVTFDVSRYFSNSRSLNVLNSSPTANTTVVRERVRPKVVYEVGSGHPTFSYSPLGGSQYGHTDLPENSERFLVTDAYAKEKGVLEALVKVSTARARRTKPGDENSETRIGSSSGHIPLRLIDLKEMKEVTLLTMNVIRTQPSKNVMQWLGDSVSSLLGQKKEARKDSAWRCDMHPAWSRDYQWLAINGVPHGDNRQVIIVFVGKNISNLF